MPPFVYRMDDRPDAPSKAAIRCSLDEARACLERALAIEGARPAARCRR